ncbi:MAG: cell division ATP-binding protein FtsE [Alphaproteobacteria bacterium]|nr:cell division ATP-binding protein FtsE [Alphaproteobacteria bacterium]
MAELSNIGLRYGDGPEVLKDVDFALRPGDFYFLTGASGAGKTSLLSLLYLANRPTRGNIQLFGNYLKETKRGVLPSIRRRVGVVFQNYRLLDHLSAYDNVALPLRASGVSEVDIKSNVEEMLSWVALKDFMHAKPDTLSGGQKQRVAIARAVINRPDILIADEPTGNVDNKMANRLLYLFEEMNKHGTSVIIATHSEDLIRKFKYPRMHLDNGRLQIMSSSDAVKGAALKQEADAKQRYQEDAEKLETVVDVAKKEVAGKTVHSNILPKTAASSRLLVTSSASASKTITGITRQKKRVSTLADGFK